MSGDIIPSPTCHRHDQRAVLIFNSSTKCVGHTTARPIATQFPEHGCMEDLTAESSFDSQAKWVIAALA